VFAERAGGANLVGAHEPQWAATSAALLLPTCVRPCLDALRPWRAIPSGAQCTMEPPDAHRENAAGAQGYDPTVHQVEW
jgi:hypothetical protein